MALPQLLVIAGPNGAGKTTLARCHLSGRLPVVNPDQIAHDRPRRDGLLDERGAGAAAIRQRENLLAQRTSFAIETTLTGLSSLRFMTRAKAAGYRVTLVFIGLASVDLSIQRVADRVNDGGHAVPVSALERRFPETLVNLKQAMSVVDRLLVLDNSLESRRLLIVWEEGRTTHRASSVPDWLTETLESIAEGSQEIGLDVLKAAMDSKARGR